MAIVKAVCVSEQKGVRKHAVDAIEIKKGEGVVRDAHGDDPKRRVSLLGDESVDKLRGVLPELAPGDFAENILTEGLTLYELPVGTRLRVGETELEVTQIGKECHQGCEIRKLTGDCVMPREGIFAEVITEGAIRPGDSVDVLAEGVILSEGSVEVLTEGAICPRGSVDVLAEGVILSEGSVEVLTEGAILPRGSVEVL